MNLNTNFLLHKTIEAISNQSFQSAIIYINQALKVAPKNSEVNRIAGVIAVLSGDKDNALIYFNKAIELNPKNANAFSNKSNLLSDAGQFDEAIELLERAAKLDFKNYEIPNNLGNIFQKLDRYDKAIESYEKAIELNPHYADAYNNLGNAYKKLKKSDLAIKCFESAININPNHYDSIMTLGCSLLESFNFQDGWKKYESRLFMQTKFISSKPYWNGIEKSSKLLIVGEQGIGDQILHASMLSHFDRTKHKIIVAIDNRLIPIFSRSFPNYSFIDLNKEIDEGIYDEYVMMGSLGKVFRGALEDFRGATHFLVAEKSLDVNDKFDAHKNLLCGISWKSINLKYGNKKSFSLDSLAPIFQIKKINFVSLQYGDFSSEIRNIANQFEIDFDERLDIDKFNDINSLVNLIDRCSFVITGSNSVAHLSGALGKKTFLLLPYSNGMFWYWHSVNGQSIWYPSIKIFQQQVDGDWTGPILELKKYLEQNLNAKQN